MAALIRYAPEWIQRDGAGRFLDGRTGSYVKGLRRTLAGLFWPHDEPPRAKLPRQMGSSMAEGLRVERQIEEALSGSQAKVRNRHSRAFLKWVEEQQLEWLASQVILYDPNAHICTAMDFVMRNPRTGDLVVIELKVGHSYMYKTARGHFREPLDKVKLSTANQCYTQLSWQLQVLREVYGVKAQGFLVKTGKSFEARQVPLQVQLQLRALRRHVCSAFTSSSLSGSLSGSLITAYALPLDLLPAPRSSAQRRPEQPADQPWLPSPEPEQ